MYAIINLQVKQNTLLSLIQCLVSILSIPSCVHAHVYLLLLLFQLLCTDLMALGVWHSNSETGRLLQCALCHVSALPGAEESSLGRRDSHVCSCYGRLGLGF